MKIFWPIEFNDLWSKNICRPDACKNRAVLGRFWWVLVPFWCWGSWKGTSSSWTMWSPSGITILNKCIFLAFLESHVNHKSNILWPIPPALYALGKFNWPYSLLFRHHSPRPFLSDPFLSDHCLALSLRHTSFWILLKSLHLLHWFLYISCYTGLLNIIHRFL